MSNYNDLNHSNYSEKQSSPKAPWCLKNQLTVLNTVFLRWKKWGCFCLKGNTMNNHQERKNTFSNPLGVELLPDWYWDSFTTPDLILCFVPWILPGSKILWWLKVLSNALQWVEIWVPIFPSGIVSLPYFITKWKIHGSRGGVKLWKLKESKDISSSSLNSFYNAGC